MPGGRYSRLRAFRIRLSPLRRGASHHGVLQGVLENGLEKRNRLRQTGRGKSREAARRTGHHHPRQYRFQEGGVATALDPICEEQPKWETSSLLAPDRQACSPLSVARIWARAPCW